ncbi:hypothetical protein AB0L34_13980 [Micromonospora sp. NPDC052213]|uniref:hypothetical protein n=1 Tax=Micromonospora sp. NPDC052213 TaxID=3155812 RepID=UPI00342A023A
MSRKRKRSREPATASVSPPFRMTLEEWARDTGMTVDQVRENVDALVVKGWLIPVAPDVWIMTIPEGVKTP